MAKNKIRYYFTLPTGDEHLFMNFIQQMDSDKSVYFMTLLEKAEFKVVGKLDKNGKYSGLKVPSGYIFSKVSVHKSGQVWVKTRDGKPFIDYHIPPLEKLEYPTEMCTIFPVNPTRYPLRIEKRQLDTNLDLNWIKKGSFGVKIYLIKPQVIEREVGELLSPLESRYPIGTKEIIKYREYRGFGFFLTLFQTPKLAERKYDEIEHWFFKRNHNFLSKPTIINDKVYNEKGKRIEISVPEVEVYKVK